MKFIWKYMFFAVLGFKTAKKKYTTWYIWILKDWRGDGLLNGRVSF